MIWYVVVFFAGFVGGWAFFKHRAKIKQVAEQDAAQLKQAAESRLKR